MSYYAEALISEAQMSLAHGALMGITENKVSFVSREDLAAAAASLLVGEGHDGAIVCTFMSLDKMSEDKNIVRMKSA